MARCTCKCPLLGAKQTWLSHHRCVRGVTCAGRIVLACCKGAHAATRVHHAGWRSGEYNLAVRPRRVRGIGRCRWSGLSTLLCPSLTRACRPPFSKGSAKPAISRTRTSKSNIGGTGSIDRMPAFAAVFVHRSGGSRCRNRDSGGTCGKGGDHDNSIVFERAATRSSSAFVASLNRPGGQCHGRNPIGS